MVESSKSSTLVGDNKKTASLNPPKAVAAARVKVEDDDDLDFGYFEDDYNDDDV